MTSPDADIVPFGKYKGRPLVDLIADRSYTDWLAAQPWFRQRYGTVYNLIVNTGAEPQDTPEHNAMQARFLDHDEALRLCSLYLWGRERLFKCWEENEGRGLSAAQRANLVVAEQHVSKICGLRFEAHGWDLLINALTYLPAREIRPAVSMPCTCVCGKSCTWDSHSADEPEARWSRCYRVGGYGTRRSDTRQRHCLLTCPHTWGDQQPYSYTTRGATSTSVTLGVELKPTLGDEYPSVLREVVKRTQLTEVRNYQGYLGGCLVVADRMTFTSVTPDKVRRIFRSQGVTLRATAELPQLNAGWLCACKECKEEDGPLAAIAT